MKDVYLYKTKQKKVFKESTSRLLFEINAFSFFSISVDFKGCPGEDIPPPREMKYCPQTIRNFVFSEVKKYNFPYLNSRIPPPPGVTEVSLEKVSELNTDFQCKHLYINAACLLSF